MQEDRGPWLSRSGFEVHLPAVWPWARQRNHLQQQQARYCFYPWRLVWILLSRIAGKFFTIWSTREAPYVGQCLIYWRHSVKIWWLLRRNGIQNKQNTKWGKWNSTSPQKVRPQGSAELRLKQPGKEFGLDPGRGRWSHHKSLSRGAAWWEETYLETSLVSGTWW